MATVCSVYSDDVCVAYRVGETEAELIAKWREKTHPEQAVSIVYVD